MRRVGLVRRAGWARLCGDETGQHTNVQAASNNGWAEVASELQLRVHPGTENKNEKTEKRMKERRGQRTRAERGRILGKKGRKGERQIKTTKDRTACACRDSRRGSLHRKDRVIPAQALGDLGIPREDAPARRYSALVRNTMRPSEFPLSGPKKPFSSFLSLQKTRVSSISWTQGLFFSFFCEMVVLPGTSPACRSWTNALCQMAHMHTLVFAHGERAVHVIGSSRRIHGIGAWDSIDEQPLLVDEETLAESHRLQLRFSCGLALIFRRVGPSLRWHWA